MRRVIELEEAEDVELVGGKAVPLAKLAKAGFKVPSGFVITSGTKIEAKKLSEAVLVAFDKLGSPRVAVRSSAVAEDGTKNAWAGQLDTFLNVTKDNLIDKIKACQDSAQSERAKAYAQQNNISAGSVAVIIQKMLPSDVSGVAFSVHPITNDGSQLVIESISGLGESLVSGAETPNTYVINKSSLKSVLKHLSNEKNDLSHKQLKELAGAIIKIENLFGLAVDVEWAYADEQLYILQSRPITTTG